jgi:hypothetical protein
MSKIVLAVLAIGLLSCGLFCQQAGANQISGSVLFNGAAMASGDSGPRTTTISFANPSWTVVSGFGDYSTFGTPATFTAFSFTGTGTGATLSGPGMQQGTFTFGTPALTFSFDLLALVSGTTTSGTIAISGTDSMICLPRGLWRALDTTSPLIFQPLQPGPYRTHRMGVLPPVFWGLRW